MKISLIILLAIISFSFSCKKEEIVPDFACDKSAKIAQQTLGSIGITIDMLR